MPVHLGLNMDTIINDSPSGLVGVNPPPPPIRRDSSLERGIIGAPPPLVRDSDHTFTAAEVEQLLAEREKEVRICA